MFRLVGSWFCAGLLAILWAGGAWAQVAKLDRVDVIESGLYNMTRGPGGSQPAATFVESTDIVVARVGSTFGFRYLLVGEPAGAPVNLWLIARIPSPGVQNPTLRANVTLTEEPFTAVIGTTHISGYSFESSWEAVPGTWILEIRYGQEKLIERRFNVVRP